MRSSALILVILLVLSITPAQVADPATRPSGGSVPNPATDCVASTDRCPLLVTWVHDGLSVDGFRIYRSGDPLAEVGAEAREYVDSTAATGYAYPYKVVAFNEHGDAERSNIDRGWLYVNPPTDLDATDDFCEYVDVRWSDNADDELGFEIYRYGTHLTTTEPNVTLYVDSTGESGLYYMYKARTITACGSSEFSVSDGGRRQPGANAPYQCAASRDDCFAVTVSWQDGSSDEVRFNVYRDDDLLATTGPDTTVYHDSTGVTGLFYMYSVSATNACGEGERSNSTVGRIHNDVPARAGGLAASEVLCGLVRLGWRDYSDDETGFKVMRDDELLVLLPPNSTSYDDSNAVIDVSHEYAIVATNGCGDAEPSNSAVGITRMEGPPAPTECVATDSVCAYVLVSWVDNSLDEQGFHVLRDDELLTVTGHDTTEIVDSTAVPEVIYAYSIVALNACGDSGPSNADSGGRLALPIPPAPLLTSPADSAECLPRHLEFEWEPVPHAAWYLLELDKDCDGENVREVVSYDTRRRLEDISGESQFCWRVSATDICEQPGAWSDSRTFVTGLGPLERPTMWWPWPVDTLEHFQWDPVVDAEGYVLTISDHWHCWEYSEEYGDETVSFYVAATETLINVYALEIYWYSAWVSALSCGTRGDSSWCVFQEGSTPVALDYLNASAETGGIAVEWATLSEEDVLGFNLYRRPSTVDSWTGVNAGLIVGGKTEYRIMDPDVTSGMEYIYRLTEVTTDGDEIGLGEVSAKASAAPGRLALCQNVPNPFNPATRIEYQVPVPGPIVLDILDPAGRRVRRLIDAHHDPGAHNAVWNGDDEAGRSVASGTYFIRLTAGDGKLTKRVILLR